MILITVQGSTAKSVLHARLKKVLKHRSSSAKTDHQRSISVSPPKETAVMLCGATEPVSPELFVWLPFVVRLA